jgi:hypothetical protein
MLVVAVASGWVARGRLKGRGFPHVPRTAAWALAGTSALMVVGAFVVPWVLLRPPQPAAIRPASTASLAIVQPASGQSVSGDSLLVVLQLSGGRIVQTASTTLTPDTGHVHVSVDGRLASMAYGLRQPIDISGLAPGSHEIEAEFVAADHGPFDPPVTATVTFVKGS